MNGAYRILSLEDGRKIRIFEAGRPHGIPVLVQRGTPQCGRLYRRWVEDAEARGIRLIGYERPGYGGSTNQAGRTVASAAQDVAAIADELGLKRLFVWGISGGGPHALACAALRPDLVVAAAALACPAPYSPEELDYFSGTGEANIELIHAALAGREACEQCVRRELSKMAGATPETIAQAIRSLVCPADAEVLTTDFAGFVLRTVREGCGDSNDGWVEDEIAFVKPWGFELSQIHVPVLIMHGGHDLMVPFSHGVWLAKRIPGAEARLLPGDGHLTLSLGRIPEIHSWLLSKI